MHRSRLALGLALGAVVAALVGALGPASSARTTYSWPPSELPEGTPSSLWYTPLLLIRHRPEAIHAEVPCSLPEALPNAARPVTVLATTRFPARNDGLAVTRRGDRLVLAVGDQVIDHVPLSDGTNVRDTCSYRIELDDGRWSIERESGEVVRDGELETLPFVTGLFSALNLRSGTPPAVEVTTAVHDSRPTGLQKAAWTFAVLAIAAALLLVGITRRPRRPGIVVASAARAAAAQVHAADGVVAAVLLAWWVLSPSYWDDGWIAARLSSYTGSGGFSTYYDVVGASNPLGYWLDWTQYWLLEVSDTLLVLRVPALGCLAVTWLLCRWLLLRGLSSSTGAGEVTLWALASAFLLGALAWGMTVRPEPVLALLVTGVAVCTVRFLARETAASLAAVAVLVPLAVSAHPAGLVSLAPLLVAAPRLFRWIGPRLVPASTIVVAGVALLAVLLFVGSDLQQRRNDSTTFEAYGTSALTWRDEAVRYERLSEFPFATPVRRGWVALAALAAVAFLLRRRRHGDGALDIGGATLAVGLALLVATPSKWGWHFGALLGIAAAAVASETAHLREEARRSLGWRARPFLILVAAMLASAWSWSPRTAWALLDLRTFDWILGLEARLSLAKLVFLLPPLLLGGAALTELARRGRSRVPETPWRVATWTSPIVAIPAIAFTLALLVADNVKTDAWTLARQNLETLRGAGGCGLADDVLTVARTSVRPLSALDGSGARGRAPVGRAVEEVPSYIVRARSPWFDASAERRVGLYVVGRPAGSHELGLEWGRRRDDRIAILDEGEISAAFLHDQGAGEPARGFLTTTELPARPPKANAFRVTATKGGIAVAPVAYENEQLTRRLEDDSAATFVLPELRMYFPCVRQPRFRDGAVEVPSSVISTFDSTSWLSNWVGSPYRGLGDLYPLERLPLADSRHPPGDVGLFAVERRIPGATLVPAMSRE